MTSFNSKNKLIELIQEERKKFDFLINQLSEEQILQSGVKGKWSIKDIIAHLMVWEQRGIDKIQLITEGKTPDIPLKGYTWRDTDLLNEEIYQKYKDEALNDIISRSHETFENLMRVMQDLPEEKLEDSFYSEGANPKTFLGKDVLYWRYDHYKYHIKQIKSLLDKEKI